MITAISFESRKVDDMESFPRIKLPGGLSSGWSIVGGPGSVSFSGALGAEGVTGALVGLAVGVTGASVGIVVSWILQSNSPTVALQSCRRRQL